MSYELHKELDLNDPFDKWVYDQLFQIAKDWQKELDQKTINETITKQCNICQQGLSLNNFSKGGFDRNGNPRIRPNCKSCDANIRKNYKSASKEYQKQQHEKLKEWKKDYYKNNKSWIQKWQQNWYKDNKEQLNSKHKIYREENQEKEQKRHAKYHKDNKEKIYAYRKRFYKEHPEKKLISSCRLRIKDLLEGSGTNNNKKYIGCSIDFLLDWFKYQLSFSHDMTFDNYGSYWHIDHVIPCSKWDLSLEEHKKNVFIGQIYLLCKQN